mmetsp:Transcript_24642/g.47203  ORF Transcript_24642/g.47203 Transcript_24642/m.47203 type:complete len:491 (+) Transcript_24642:109-1581(+)
MSTTTTDGRLSATKPPPPPEAAGDDDDPPPPPPAAPAGSVSDVNDSIDSLKNTTRAIGTDDASILNPEAALEQLHLAEFNSWLYRWNNYQQHLANYWQGRYHSLYLQVGGGEVVAGGKKVRGKGKGKGKGKGGDGIESKVEGKWNLRFQELVDFKEEHGHTNVPKEFTYKYSPPLGHWVGRMRHLHKKDALDLERTQRLLAIGFEFVITKSDKINFSVVWDKSYQALKAFKDMNGHIEVPVGYKPQPDMAELDGWITRQRKHFKDDKLPHHLTTKLQDVGLNLGGRGRPFGVESEELFTRNYKALVEYSNKYGDCDVPEKYDEDRELGTWAKAQRDTYSDGMLPNKRIKSLNQIGFNFYHGRKSEKTKATDPWQRRIAELQAYKEKTGNTQVPRKFTLNLGLGDFVYNQKMAYKDDNLPADKIKCLDEMGFDWKPKPAKAGKRKPTNWDKRFDELEAFKSKHGNLNVPAKYTPNPNLSAWTSKFVLPWNA